MTSQKQEVKKGPKFKKNWGIQPLERRNGEHSAMQKKGGEMGGMEAETE